MTRPRPSSRNTRTRRWFRAACRATRAAGCSSGSSPRTAPPRCGSGGSAAREWGPRDGSPRHRLIHDALDERVVLEARLLVRLGQFVLGGDERVGIHFKDVHLVVVREAHVHTTVVLQPQRVECGAADLADPARQLLRDAFGENVLDLLFLPVLLIQLGFVGVGSVLADPGLAVCRMRPWTPLQSTVA